MPPSGRCPQAHVSEGFSVRRITQDASYPIATWVSTMLSATPPAGIQPILRSSRCRGTAIRPTVAVKPVLPSVRYSGVCWVQAGLDLVQLMAVTAARPAAAIESGGVWRTAPDPGVVLRAAAGAMSGRQFEPASSPRRRRRLLVYYSALSC